MCVVNMTSTFTLILDIVYYPISTLSVDHFLSSLPPLILPCYCIYSNHICNTLFFFSYPSLLFNLNLISPYTSSSPSLSSLAWSQSSVDEDASGSGIYSIRNGLHTPPTVPGSNLRCSILAGRFIYSSLRSFIFSCCSFSAYECDVTWIHVRVLMYGKCDFRGRWQKRCVLVDMQISYSGRL